VIEVEDFSEGDILAGVEVAFDELFHRHVVPLGGEVPDLVAVEVEEVRVEW